MSTSAAVQEGRDQLIKALFGHLKGGFVELRAIPLVKSPDNRVVQKFVTTLSEVNGFVEEYGQRGSEYGVYFGVCKRVSKSGRKSDVTHATTLWADIDCIANGNDTDVILSMVLKLPESLQPSAVVRSGGGLHLYWFLDEATTDLQRVESVNQSIMHVVGGDNVYDVSRVLRLPGSYNNKRSHKVRCEVVICRPHIRFRLDDIAKAVEEYKWCIDGSKLGSRIEVAHRQQADVSRTPESRLAQHFDGTGVLRKKLETLWRDRVREHAPRGYYGVHEALVVTTARLAVRHKSDDYVVSETMRLMRLVPGSSMSSWDWRGEENKIRRALATWREKLSVLRSSEKAAGKNNAKARQIR